MLYMLLGLRSGGAFVADFTVTYTSRTITATGQSYPVVTSLSASCTDRTGLLPITASTTDNANYTFGSTYQSSVQSDKEIPQSVRFGPDGSDLTTKAPAGFQLYWIS